MASLAAAQTRKPRRSGAFCTPVLSDFRPAASRQLADSRGLHTHVTHAAHSTGRAMSVFAFFLRRFGNHHLGRQQQAGN